MVALVCGPPPDGRARWTVRLLAQEASRRGIADPVGRETIRVVLARQNLKPWREKNVVRSKDRPRVHRPDGGRASPLRPASPREVIRVICLDERPVQLLDPARPNVAMHNQGGSAAQTMKNMSGSGTANASSVSSNHWTGRRLTYASNNRKGRAFARALQRIARRYQSARKIHLVMDNLNTHAKKSVTDALGPVQGRLLWNRFKVHHTPKHASWLNAAEMEASLVSRECLGSRRIGHLHTLTSQVAAWRAEADRTRRQIRWKFTVNDARRVFRYDGIITSRSEH